ncbi:hypothetical protein QQP08_014242 [Theobroma cacao]|nr:hypothetical protein QQP08_014242 [Theobroma cacao]
MFISRIWFLSGVRFLRLHYQQIIGGAFAISLTRIVYIPLFYCTSRTEQVILDVQHHGQFIELKEAGLCQHADEEGDTKAVGRLEHHVVELGGRSFCGVPLEIRIKSQEANVEE